MLVKDHYSYNKKELIIMTYLILRDYYMTFPISALVSHSPRRPYQARQRRFAVGLDMGVTGWYQGRYGKFHIIIYLSHILHWLLYWRKSLNWRIAKKVDTCKYFCFSSLVSKRYQTSVQWRYKVFVKSTIWRRWHLNGNFYSTWRIHLS